MPLRDELRAADAGTLSEIKKEAESYLSAQLQSGIAADQRAFSFVSLMAAAVVVVAGGGGALLIAEQPHFWLGWTCIGIAAGLLVAMGCVASSAMAIDFWYVGSWPKDWTEDVQARRPLSASLAEQLENLNDRIDKNHTTLTQNAKWMNAGVWIAWGSLLIGGLTAASILAFGY